MKYCEIKTFTFIDFNNGYSLRKNPKKKGFPWSTSFFEKDSEMEDLIANIQTRGREANSTTDNLDIDVRNCNLEYMVVDCGKKGM